MGIKVLSASPEKRGNTIFEIIYAAYLFFLCTFLCLLWVTLLQQGGWTR